MIFAEAPRAKSSGSNRIVKSEDPKVIENYIKDESSIITGTADAILYPNNELQISEILKESNTDKINVTVSGAGTGITGSKVPMGGIVISTELLTHIEPENVLDGELAEIDEPGKKYSILIARDIENEFYAIVPPGITIGTFKKIVEEKGLYYPPDPTETTAFMGGTVATNASGARTYYYGSTREFVRRICVMLPTGQILNIKRGKVFAKNNKFKIMLNNEKQLEIELPTYVMPNIKKNAAGYFVKPEMDLIDLFIGSEGTLGIITEIEVKLIEKPKDIYSFFAHFSDEQSAIELAKMLKRSINQKILSIEFFDRNSTEFIRKTHPSKIPENSNGIIYFELDSPDDQALQEILKLLKNCDYLFSNKGFNLNTILLSEDDAKEIRHALPEGINNFLKSKNLPKVATDIAVPEKNLDEMIATYHDVGNSTNIQYFIFGHIGDNHLHFNFLPKNNEELKLALNACIILWKKAVELGGTVTAEHGVGKKYYIENNEKKPLLEIMYGIKGLNEIAKLKHVLDPDHILNIGNIIPKEYLENYLEKS